MLQVNWSCPVDLVEVCCHVIMKKQTPECVSTSRMPWTKMDETFLCVLLTQMSLWSLLDYSTLFTKYFQYIHIYTICINLGVEKYKALPGFHAYTGCDTTSQFRSKGKKSCWEAWKVYPEVTEAFIKMVVQPIKPLEITCTLFELLERFICILYDKTTSVVMVNDLRKKLFSRGSLSMENIPPSQVMYKKYLF